MILVILQFHDSMLLIIACVRLDDMVCSWWLAVEQGLRQECVLTLLVLNILTRSTIGGGGRGCNKFVPVLGGNGTKIATTGDIFDQLPDQMR